MDTRRQLKIASVIQEAFAQILIRDGRSIYGKAFVTVTKVWTSSDLSLVRFYLSIYNEKDPADVIRKFNEKKVDLKRKLAEKIRHQLRVMPEMEFFQDDTLEYAYHIEEVFKKIKEEDDRIKATVVSKVLDKKEKIKKAATKKKAPVKRVKK